MSDTARDRDARVQALVLGAVASKATPGLQYVVVDGGAILLDVTAGWADVAARRPMRPDTTMMAYSMTKTITAAAVLQLVEVGAVRLDAPVTDYLRDVPYGDRVLVRHLLAQTSGIPNPVPLRWVHLPEEDAGYDEHARLARILARNPRLAFEPGERYAYSNISYWLLGQLVERVTGAGFADHVRDVIFRPLHVPEEEIGFTIPARERHAKGYLPRLSLLNLLKPFLLDRKFVGAYEGGWLHVKDNYLDGASFGGIVATARAVARFLQDQLRGASVLFRREETRRAFLADQTDGAGRPVPMTLGWHVHGAGRERYLFKEGGGAGFHGEMRLYPEHGVGCVALANSGAFRVKWFLDTANGEYLGARARARAGAAGASRAEDGRAGSS